MKREKKQEENETLQEHDAFVRSMLALKDAVLVRRRVLSFGLVVVAGVLLVVAIMAGIAEEADKSARSTIDMAETIREMEDAAAKYPSDTGLLLRLGHAYVRSAEKGALERAESTFERALRSAESELEKSIAALALGKVKTDLKKYGEALELFENTATARQAESLMRNEAFWYAGRCYELLGRPDEAREMYARIRTGKDVAGAWRLLAEFRLNESRQESLE